MSVYLKPTDIKANVAQGMDLNTYLDEADSAIIDLGQELGAESTDITNPPHYQVKHYAVNYVMLRLCEDKMGTCSPDSLQFDKYYQLCEYYRRRVGDIRNRISVEMMTGNVLNQRDRAILTGMLFRG
jgi:hypothetical protein